MKMRRVFVTLELETSHTLWALRQPSTWGTLRGNVLQVQANVAQGVKRKKRRARRKA